MLTAANDRSRRSGEGGVALLHVLILGGALFGIAVAALGLSRFDLMITSNLVNGTKARWVAIAGAEAAKAWLAANGGACLDAPGGCSVGPQAMGEGSYQATIERHVIASRLRITSTGTAPNHARKIVEEVIIAPGFDPEHGLIQIDGAAVPSDLEEPGGGPGIRIPSWTIDGTGYSAATGLPDPACAAVPPVGGVPDPSETGLPEELDDLRCKIVQRANECCNFDGTTNQDACVLTPGACEPGVCEDASCNPGRCAIGSCLPGVCNDGTCVAGECSIGTCGPGACGDGVPCASGYCEVGSCTPGDCAVGSTCAAGTCETSNCRAGGTCSPSDPTCVSATCNSKGKACRPGTCGGADCVAGICDVGIGSCNPGSCGGGNCVAGTCTLTGCGPGTCPAGATCVTAGCPASGCGPGDACTSGDCIAATCAATCDEEEPCDPSGPNCVTATCSLPGCPKLCPYDAATATGLCEWEPGLATVRGTDPAAALFDTPYWTDVDLTDATTDPPPDWANWAQDCDAALPDCCKQMSLSDPTLRPGTLGSTPPRGPLRLDTSDRADEFPVEAMTSQEIDALEAAIEASLDAALAAPASDRLCIVDQQIRGGTHIYGSLENPKITIVSTPNDQNTKVRALSRSAPCTTGPGDGASNLVLKDGAVVQGAGVLILPRELDVEDATFDWKGLIVILENGKIVALRDACGEICGGLLLQTNNDRNNARLDLDKSRASATCLKPNNAFSITRCCDALDEARQLLTRTVSWREVFDAP